jgi:hypothetical protein
LGSTPAIAAAIALRELDDEPGRDRTLIVSAGMNDSGWAFSLCSSGAYIVGSIGSRTEANAAF